MFTGIVEEIGSIANVSSNSLSIKAQTVQEGMKTGDSLSVNGVCLTVTSVKGGVLIVDIMPETIRRTWIEKLRNGDRVNLERAMPADGRFGGHFVQGHVDDIGKVINVSPEGEALIVTILAQVGVMRYVVKKGFIAVDGVSLTVVENRETSFTVSLVKYTRDQTIMGTKKTGDMVNLEVDIIAKYVEMLKTNNNQSLISNWLSEYDSLKTE